MSGASLSGIHRPHPFCAEELTADDRPGTSIAKEQGWTLDTVLYGVVQDHLTMLLATAREQSEHGELVVLTSTLESMEVTYDRQPCDAGMAPPR